MYRSARPTAPPCPTALALSREIEAWRRERLWQLQSARWYLAGAEAREANPPPAWQPCISPEHLRARASEAVRRARLAHLEFMAVRRLEHNSVAGQLSVLAHRKTLTRGERP